MRKYFDLVLDLLEIEGQTEYQALASEIEKYEEKTILFAHRSAFLLSAYLKLLRGQIAPEEFVLIWDIDSVIPLYTDGQKTSESLISELKEWIFPSEEVIIIDQKAWNVMLSEDEKYNIATALAKKDKKLILG